MSLLSVCLWIATSLSCLRFLIYENYCQLSIFHIIKNQSKTRNINLFLINQKYVIIITHPWSFDTQSTNIIWIQYTNVILLIWFWKVCNECWEISKMVSKFSFSSNTSNVSNLFVKLKPIVLTTMNPKSAESFFYLLRVSGNFEVKKGVGKNLKIKIFSSDPVSLYNNTTWFHKALFILHIVLKVCVKKDCVCL